MVTRRVGAVDVAFVDVGEAPATLRAAVWRNDTELRVDADGAPNAYGPPGRPRLDVIANGEAAGVVRGADGQPVLNDRGYYVSPTALGDRRYPVTDSRRYVDATTVQYLAIGRAALEAFGAEVGDLAYVVDVVRNRETVAIVGDVAGSGFKAHEASIALHQALGFPGNPRGGAAPAAGEVAIVLFPGTAAGWARPSWRQDAVAAYHRFGGRAQLDEVLRQLGRVA